MTAREWFAKHVGGNWKINYDINEVIELLEALMRDMENKSLCIASYQRNAESVKAVASDYYDITDLTAVEIDRLRRESSEMMHKYLSNKASR